MRIGYQGIAGSYSETCIQAYLAEATNESIEAELQGHDNFQAIVDGLLAGSLDVGFFPVENSTTGLITRTVDLFKGLPIFVTEERYQAVNHSLWGLPGASIEQLREVYSHPEALSQCRSFFDMHPWIEAVPYVDTAQAALHIKATGDPAKAALAGPRNGELYQLIPLLENIQTEATNVTRFFLARSSRDQTGPAEEILENYHEEYPARTRWLLYIETSHKPGALVTLLQVFNLFSCNLEGLDARPIANRPFRYGFFIEVDVSQLDGDYALLWKNLEFASEYLQVIAAFEPIKRVEA